MRIRRNTYTMGAGEIVVEAPHDNVIVLQVESTYPSSRNTAMRNGWHEGVDINVDGAIGGIRCEGSVTAWASIAMTDKECRALIAELQRAVDS